MFVIRGSSTARPADAGPPPLPAARCIYLESRWRPFLGGPGASAPRNLHEGEEGHPHHRDCGPCRRQRPWQLGVIDSACQHSFARLEAWRAGASLLNRAHHLGPHDREDRCGRLRAAAPIAQPRDRKQVHLLIFELSAARCRKHAVGPLPFVFVLEASQSSGLRICPSHHLQVYGRQNSGSRVRMAAT